MIWILFSHLFNHQGTLMLEGKNLFSVFSKEWQFRFIPKGHRMT